MRKRDVGLAMMIAVLVQGCSSRPREFAPTVSAAPLPEAQAKFDSDLADCRQMLVAGKLDGNGRLASAGAGAAVGAATVAGGAAAASSAGLYAGAAVASATIIALPFVAIGGAWAMAKIKRNKKEKAIQAALAGCLAERGHAILGWEKVRKAKARPAATGAKAETSSL